MPVQAGLCYADFSFFCVSLFLMSPLSLNNAWTDRNADCCVNTVDDKYYGWEFGELRSMDVVMATNFEARDGRR